MHMMLDSHHPFELMTKTRGRSPTSSLLLCSLFRDALGPPQGAYFDYLRPRERQAAAGYYREIFATYAVRQQGILLRTPNCRAYIRPHDQEYLGCLGSE